MSETQCHGTVTVLSLPLEIISNILSFMPTWHLQLGMGQETLSTDQLFGKFAMEMPGTPWNPTLGSQYPGTPYLLVCRHFRDAAGLLRLRNFFAGHALITSDYDSPENGPPMSFLSMITNLMLSTQDFAAFLDKKLYSRMTSLENVTFVHDDAEELSPQCSSTSCRSVRLADIPDLSKKLDRISRVSVSDEIFHPDGELALCHNCFEDWISDTTDAPMDILGDDQESREELDEVAKRLELEAPHSRTIEYIVKMSFVVPFADFYVQCVSSSFLAGSLEAHTI